MQLQTTLNIAPATTKISLQNPILLLGSCFSDEVGNLLSTHKFNVYINPFGTIFNPISCLELLEICLLDKQLAPETFVKDKELYFNYLLHSNFFAYQLADLQQDIENCKLKVKEFFNSQEQKVLIFTFGTAYIYELQEPENAKISVANCHKQPAKLFEKRLVTVAEILSKFTILYQLLPPNIEIILTVSPVRHIKDTLPLNAVSKAILRLVCHELSQKFENVSYFPSYELMNDELRDYRFYATDMLHPTPQAVEYIYEKFCQTYMSSETLDFQHKWKKILQQLSHHSFHKDTVAHQQFLQNLLQNLQAITTVDVSQEIAEVMKELLIK